jgi:hypothetical protein
MAVLVIYYENQNATGSPRSQLGGPSGPTDTGFEWRYAGWVVNTVTHATGALEVRMETLFGDNFAQAQAKMLAALKAAAVAQGFTPTLALRNLENAPLTIP